MQKLMLIALFFFAQAQSALAGGFLTEPSSGALVADDPVTFRWNAVPGAQAYFLNVRRQDNPDLLYFSQQIPASALSVDVSGMPNDDSQLVADFWYLVGGAWEYEVIGFVSSRSFLTSPAPGATVEGLHGHDPLERGSGSAGLLREPPAPRKPERSDLLPATWPASARSVTVNHLPNDWKAGSCWASPSAGSRATGSPRT